MHIHQHRRLPRVVDTTRMFTWYKTPPERGHDIRPHYFADADSTLDSALDSVLYNVDVPKTDTQFADYATLDYEMLTPLLRRYFRPSVNIQRRMRDLEAKYELDPSRTCVLFYRGNDKVTEVRLPEYDQYVTRANELIANDPDLRLWIQSDETELLEAMNAIFPRNVIMYDDIRHMRKCLSTVDRVFAADNSEMSKQYVAITYLMSRCRYVICGTGNCSLWIALFRGNATGITQLRGHGEQ